MCDSCGCNELVHPTDGQHHPHKHDHEHPHGHGHKVMNIGQDIIKTNNKLAQENRQYFEQKNLFVVNLIGSPGCGKTTLLERLARRFKDTMAVIEGDVQTSRDAERVIRAGSRAHQIQTNGACHLDAPGIAHALNHLDLNGCKLLVIENVGNLVCPASFDLGEHEKIAILSLPEGDDKILKYPSLFHRSQVLLINKTDLADCMDFNMDTVINECRSLNRTVTVFAISARTGEGLDAFCDHLAQKAGIPLAGEK